MICSKCGKPNLSVKCGCGGIAAKGRLVVLNQENLVTFLGNNEKNRLLELESELSNIGIMSEAEKALFSK